MINAAKNSNVDRGGLYIHVPYCRKKCIYCDFFSVGAGKIDFAPYVTALLAEFKFRKSELPAELQSIYLGGGTPSILPFELLEVIVDEIKMYQPRKFVGDGTVDCPIKFSGEFTIEVNPEDVTIDNCRDWKRMGVNRVSMGVQSFDDADLKKLNRVHTTTDVFKSINILKTFFDNISIDLIFGLPNQTVEMWHKNLNIATRLGIKHISLYNLMYEESTTLTLMRNQGRIKEAAEEDCIVMFQDAVDILRSAGFERYEISNYAIPGYESVHNSSYWFGKPYLGIGAGAHSYNGINIRKSNPSKLKDYISIFNDNKEISKMSFSEVEVLTDEELREEYILTRMRTSYGISIDDFRLRFGKSECDELLKRASEIKEYLKINNEFISLNDRGVMISDNIILKLAL